MNLARKQFTDSYYSSVPCRFDQFDEVMREYFDLGHVPPEDLNIPTSEVFYLPVHAVHKQASTTMKIHAVFDASMKSASGVSLNDTLMVGQTVYT